jgi:ABC-type branched-subunit amino acid transport system substrate-binding protein
MLKRRRLIPAVLAVVALVVVGCSSNNQSSSSQSSGSPYSVGLIEDQTGVSAQIANPTGAGIQAYIKQLNGSGGVNGRKIELASPIDSKSTADGASAAFQQALQSQPIAILGSVNSLGIAAAVPVVSSANTPVMIGSAPDTLLVPPKPWLFTQVMSAASMVSVSLTYLEQTMGSLQGKRLAVSAAASAFGDGYVDAFQKEAAKRGFTVATVDRSALTLTSFATNAAKIVESKADALLLLDVPSSTPLIVHDLQAAGFTNPIVGYESAGEPAIIKSVASSQYVSFRGAPVPPAGGDMVKAAQAAGVEASDNSLWFSYGWNEGAILAEALKSCGDSCTGSTLMKKIEGVHNFTPPGNSTYGPVSYSADNHFAANSVQFFTWDPQANAEKPVQKPIKVS